MVEPTTLKPLFTVIFEGATHNELYRYEFYYDDFASQKISTVS